MNLLRYLLADLLVDVLVNILADVLVDNRVDCNDRHSKIYRQILQFLYVRIRR